jgi:hypothetical protein
VDREPTSGSRVGTKMTTVKHRTFTHPDQPMSGQASGSFSLRSRSVIEYLDLELRGSVEESNMRC